MEIKPGNLADARVQALLAYHLESAQAKSPPMSVHTLDSSGLSAPNVRFWTVWDGEALIGMGALMAHSPALAEIKSMRTVDTVQRKGVGSAMLRYIIGQARAAGHARVSLETGSSVHYGPARALYVKHGFKECPPFANYVLDPHSVFYTLDLTTQD